MSHPPDSKDIARKREALEELVQSEGWQYFVARVGLEWSGTGYVARMRLALQKNDLLEPKVVDRTAQEIIRLLRWPMDQIGELKGNTE